MVSLVLIKCLLGLSCSIYLQKNCHDGNWKEKQNKSFFQYFLKGKFNLNGFGHVAGILLWSYGDLK